MSEAEARKALFDILVQYIVDRERIPISVPKVGPHDRPWEFEDEFPQNLGPNEPQVFDLEVYEASGELERSSFSFGIAYQIRRYRNAPKEARFFIEIHLEIGGPSDVGDQWLSIEYEPSEDRGRLYSSDLGEDGEKTPKESWYFLLRFDPDLINALLNAVTADAVVKALMEICMFLKSYIIEYREPDSGKSGSKETDPRFN